MHVQIISLATLYRRINLDKFMAHNPTLIGSVLTIKFYEHPTRGDEAGLIAVDTTGAYQTDWFDIPRECDLID